MNFLSPLLILAVRLWIRWQRFRHLSRAEPLSARDRDRLTPYFDSELLDRVRVRTIGSLAPAWSAPLLRTFGLNLPLDFGTAIGIAVGDLVLLTHPVPTDSRRSWLLCHELVHVAQYQILGIDGFARRYVEGWLAAGRRYMEIPLEIQAYGLERAFRDSRIQPFLITDEVRRELAVE